MKIIINESQLRLIVENEEKKERLLTITIDMIVGGESFDDILELYNTEKEKKNFVGIKLLGSVDFSRGFGNKIGSGAIEFCDELVEVNGDLRVVNNYTVSFPKLRRVTGDMILSMTEVRSLPELRYVGRNLTLKRSKISELPELESVGGSLDLERSQINSLPNLESVGGFLDLNYSKIESLPKLESVGEDLYLEKTPLSKKTTEEELRSKINVEGNVYL
jgi:hypothetical protein